MRFWKWGLSILWVVSLVSASRFFLLDLSFDELIQFDILRGKNLSDVLDYIRLKDHQLPFQYLLLHPIVNSSMGGGSTLLLRLPSLIFSIGTLVFFFHTLSFYVEKKKWQFFGVAWLASSLLFYQYSLSSRPYAAMMFFFSVSLYMSQRILYFKSSWKSIVAFIGALVLLSSTHYFGVLYGAFILIGTLYALGSWKRKLSLLLIFLISSVGTYWLMSLTVYSHPQKLFPHFEKIIGGGFKLSTGPISLLAILIFSFLVKKMRAKKFARIYAYLLLPVLISLGLSLVWRPVFEYRFLLPSLLLASILLVSILESLEEQSYINKFGRSFQPFLSLILCLQQVSYACMKVDSKTFPKTSELKEYIAKNYPGDELKVIACGNCPSFYFDREQLECWGGWNFKDHLKSSQSKSKLAMVYKMNARFCLPQLPEKRVKVLSLPGLDLYSLPGEASSFSK